MKPVLALVLGLAVYEMLRSVRPRLALAVAVGFGLLVWRPVVVGAAAGAASAFYLRHRLSRRRRAEEEAHRDVALLGELVHLGLGAGLTFRGALELAADEVHPLLAGEARTVLRRSHLQGMAAVLQEGAGRAGRLYLLAARAALTGAPLVPAVEAFVDEARHVERTRLEAKTRRLPVRLLLPLATLILPGFVILTVGPAFLGAVERLRF